MYTFVVKSDGRVVSSTTSWNAHIASLRLLFSARGEHPLVLPKGVTTELVPFGHVVG